MPRTGRAKLLAGVALAVALAVATVGVVVGASDNTFDGTTVSKRRGSYEHGDLHPHRPPGLKPCPKGSVESHTRPARMLGPDSATTLPSAELYPVRNGWAAAACFGVTWVWAGANGEHPSTGRLVIARYGRWPHARIHVDVDVPQSGALKITDAPLGPEVATSAQSAELEFTSKRGTTGTLDLSTDTVTLATGEVIKPAS
jgi:hypothetical protein